MHPRFSADHFELVAHLFLDRFYQRSSSLRVENAHSANMPREMSFADEIRHHRLIQSGRKLVSSVARGGECIHQVLGHNHVTQAQRWKHYFTERTDVNHSRARVQALQRGNRSPSQPVFAIVIIFNDPSAASGNPIEELHPSRGGHSHTQRILMRWRDVNGTCAASPADSFRYVQSLIIDGHRYKLSTGRHQRMARTGISRFLDPDALIGIQENLRREL